MLVQRLLDFIQELSVCQNLHQIDVYLLQELTKQIEILQSPPTDQLPQPYCNLEQLFRQRWEGIVDTDHDYTLCEYNDANEQWIKLAFDLVKDIKKTYLQILIPSILLQQLDPIMLNKLDTYYADCIVHIVKQLPNNNQYNDSYVYVEDEQTLYLLRDKKLPAAIRSVDEIAFNFELLQLLNGVKNQYGSSIEFNTLLIKHGCYPYLELRQFYLMQTIDKTTQQINYSLASVSGLFAHMAAGCPLSTFDHYQDVIPRALTIVELSRIRKKQGVQPYNFDDQTYGQMWELLCTSEVQRWKLKGKLPTHVLPPLMKLLDLFFLESFKGHDLAQYFRPQLLIWSQQLARYPINDINCLYGQEIGSYNNHLFASWHPGAQSCGYCEISARNYHGWQRSECG